jgi:hypothetical protein
VLKEGSTGRVLARAVPGALSQVVRLVLIIPAGYMYSELHDKVPVQITQNLSFPKVPVQKLLNYLFLSEYRIKERLDQGHLCPKNIGPGNQTQVSAVGGDHSSKELFEQHVNCYSDHLHMSPGLGSPQCMWLHEHT